MSNINQLLNDIIESQYLLILKLQDINTGLKGEKPIKGKDYLTESLISDMSTEIQNSFSSYFKTKIINSDLYVLLRQYIDEYIKSLFDLRIININDLNLDEYGYAPANKLSLISTTKDTKEKYISVQLEKDKTYQIYITGMYDTYLYLYDNNMQFLKLNDDFCNSDLDDCDYKSRIEYKATYSGTHIIKISGYILEYDNELQLPSYGLIKIFLFNIYQPFVITGREDNKTVTAKVNDTIKIPICTFDFGSMKVPDKDLKVMCHLTLPAGLSFNIENNVVYLSGVVNLAIKEQKTYAITSKYIITDTQYPFALTINWNITENTGNAEITIININDLDLDEYGYMPANKLSLISTTEDAKEKYISVQLEKDKTYQIFIAGGYDTYLYLYDNNMQFLTSNDDFEYNEYNDYDYTSRIEYKATYSGTHIIKISGYILEREDGELPYPSYGLILVFLFNIYLPLVITPMEYATTITAKVNDTIKIPICEFDFDSMKVPDKDLNVKFYSSLPAGLSFNIENNVVYLSGVANLAINDQAIYTIYPEYIITMRSCTVDLTITWNITENTGNTGITTINWTDIPQDEFRYVKTDSLPLITPREKDEEIHIKINLTAGTIYEQTIRYSGSISVYIKTPSNEIVYTGSSYTPEETGLYYICIKNSGLSDATIRKFAFREYILPTVECIIPNLNIYHNSMLVEIPIAKWKNCLLLVLLLSDLPELFNLIIPEYPNENNEYVVYLRGYTPAEPCQMTISLFIDFYNHVIEEPVPVAQMIDTELVITVRSHLEGGGVASVE